MKPQTTNKAWGREEIWANVPSKYLGKTFHINMKNKLPSQYHEKKESSLYIIRGVLTIHVKNQYTENIKQIKLLPGDCYHISPKVRYSFESKGGDVVLAEVSTYYLDEMVKITG